MTRAAGGGGRMPDWLSTHPSPGEPARADPGADRAARAPRARIGRSRASTSAQLDGMVFGENPREGFFQGNAFYHPDLRFQLAFPRGFKTQNQKQAVVG